MNISRQATVRRHSQRQGRAELRPLGKASRPLLGLTVGGLSCLAPNLWGQYALQVSDANQQYADSLKQTGGTSPTAIPNYNIKLGPTLWKFSAGLSAGYNSNPSLGGYNYNNTSGGSGYIAPSVTATMYTPLTDKSMMTLGATVGYTDYFSQSSYSQWYVSPNTQLAYNLYVGDVRLTFYERASISQSAYLTDPTVTYRAGNYASFNNDIGASASMALDQGSVGLSYDHNNTVQLSGNTGLAYGGVGNMASEVVSANAGYNLLPQLTVGPQVGFDWISYQQSQLGAAFQWNAGLSSTWQASQALSLDGSVGYTVYSPETPYGSFNENTGSMYFQLGLRHQVTKYLNYSLNGSRSLTPGYYAGPTLGYTVGLGLGWSSIRDFPITGTFSYSHGQGVYGQMLANYPGAQPYVQGTYDSYNLGFGVSHAITKKLSANLAYSLSVRSQANYSYGDYTVNNVSLGATYSF